MIAEIDLRDRPRRTQRLEFRATASDSLRAQRERNHTRCIGKKLPEITNPFGASAQG
jgi:hypothetical protein